MTDSSNEHPRTILERGVDAWNAWRAANPTLYPDLSNAILSRRNLSGYNLADMLLCEVDLSEAMLGGVDLSGSDLSGADLGKAHLIGANLSSADLRRANLSWSYLDRGSLRGADLGGAQLFNASLRQADLSGANLAGAVLAEANLRGASLRRADLTRAFLHCAHLVETDFTGATLVECRVYGVSAWRVNTTDAVQKDLLITEPDQPSIHVDNLDMAQFTHLLLSNERIRGALDTLTTKAVLILGRFTPERKRFLDALRSTLREHDYVSIVFDFDKPASRNLTETMSTLAHLARFVIADITEASSIPQELQRIVPDLPSVPIQPILEAGKTPFGMFDDFFDYKTVLAPVRYDSLDSLVGGIEQLIAPALALAESIQRRRHALRLDTAAPGAT